MTPEETMAARMYPAAPDVSAPATPSPPSAAAADPSTTADEQATSVQPLDGPSEAERAAQMADAAAMVPESPDAYTQALASGGFEQLQSQARYDGDHESVAAFKEGQQVAGELLHEHGVPVREAQAVTRSLAAWHSRPASTAEQLAVSHERCLAALRKEWGRDFDDNLAHARAVAAAAVAKAPWMSELIARGAGNDPELLKQFATIGRRRARRAP